MAKVRRKYNPARHIQTINGNAINRMRVALMGCTLSYSSTWGEDAQMCPTYFERALREAKGDHKLVATILETWEFDWTVYLTINCETPYKFYDQPLKITARAFTGSELGELIYSKYVPMGKDLCNHSQIMDWGFFAEITDHDAGK